MSVVLAPTAATPTLPRRGRAYRCRSSGSAVQSRRAAPPDETSSSWVPAFLNGPSFRLRLARGSDVLSTAPAQNAPSCLPIDSRAETPRRREALKVSSDGSFPSVNRRERWSPPGHALRPGSVLPSAEKKTEPPQAEDGSVNRADVGPDQLTSLRRPATPSPTRPRPMRATVAGSGMAGPPTTAVNVAES